MGIGFTLSQGVSLQILVTCQGEERKAYEVGFLHLRES